jgi:hypothetical protein
VARASVRELIRLSPLENHDYADAQKTRENPCFCRANTVLRRCNRARRMAKLPVLGRDMCPEDRSFLAAWMGCSKSPRTRHARTLRDERFHREGQTLNALESG